MEIRQIKELLEPNDFIVLDVEYKDPADKVRYGLSFDAMTYRVFKIIRVNSVTIKAKRIIEEFGNIVFIYNGNQASIPVEEIRTLIIE